MAGGAAVVGAAAAVLAIVTGFGGSAPSPSGPTLRLVSWADVDSLDPARSFTEAGWSLLGASCTPLMSVIKRNGKTSVEAAGAASYPKISADGRTYVFEIRRNLRFSNGVRVRAAHYAHALGRLRHPRMDAPEFDLPDLVADITSVRATARTLRIRLRRPAGDFVTRAAMPYFCPVPLRFPIDPGGVDLTGVGSGPYRIVSRVRRERVVLRRNPFWHGRKPRFASIVFTVTGTPESVVRATASGRYDYAFSNVTRELAPEFVRRYGIGRGRLFFKRQLILWHLSMNVQSPLFRNNVRLRRAVNYGLDRRELVRQINPFSQHPTDQLLPRDVPGYRDAKLYPLNRANVRVARRLARGNLRARRAVLYAPDFPLAQRLLPVIVHNLEQIGLDVETRTFSRGVLFARLRNPAERYDFVGPLFWIADVPDPYNFVGQFFAEPHTSEVGSNVTRFAHAPTIRRIRRADRLRGRARYRALGHIEIEIMREFAPLAPISHASGLVVVSRRLGCVRFHPMGGLDLTRLCLRG